MSNTATLEAATGDFPMPGAQINPAVKFPTHSFPDFPAATPTVINTDAGVGISLLRVPKKVYLAGAIAGTTYGECNDWREYAAGVLRRWGIDGYSPLRSKQFLASQERMPLVGDRLPGGNVMSSAKGINLRDHNDCLTADAILVNLLGTRVASIGTVMEIAWGFAYRKPSVVVLDENNIHHHPMIHESAGLIVETLDEGLEVIRTLLLP